MIVASSVRIYGGNGLCGVCTTCEDLVPVLPSAGRHRCMNHGGDTPPNQRTTAGRAWTPTKLHMLIPLPSGEAFCRACRRVVVPVGARHPRCPAAVKRAHQGRSGTIETPYVDSWCRSCGRKFRSVQTFDDHLDAEGRCPDHGEMLL